MFFLAAEANNGDTIGLGELGSAIGISKIQAHLYQGYGFGEDHFGKISNYVKTLLRNMPPNSDTEIIIIARKVIGEYESTYESRQRELNDIKGDKSFFQGNVRKYIENLFGVEFFSEKQVKMAVSVREVTIINDDGNRETIKVHGGVKFDGYLELTRPLKDYLGIDDKWLGIAFEAMGTYWHSLPAQKEADRKKRLICKEKNVILLEIWESWDESTYLTEILKQIKDQTGLVIKQEKLNELSKYIGDR